MERNPESRDPESSSSLSMTIARYAGSKAYAFAMRILTGFMRPFLLAPELFGIWHLFALILQYVEYYLHLGCRAAMRFRLARLLAEKKTDEANRVVGATYKGSLASHSIGAIATLILALGGDWEAHIRDGLLTVAVIIMTLWYQHFLVQYLQAEQNFAPVTKANYIRATISLFAGAPLIYFFSIHGVYWTALLSEAVLILYLRHHCRHRFGYRFRWPVYRSLTGEGFPILVFDIASNLARTADRLLIAALLGTEQLGFYALAAFVFTALLEVPGAAREVLEPKMMADSAETSEAELLEGYFFRPLLNTAYYIPLLVGPAILAAPLIELILPKYVDGILPAQILALGGYFLAMTFVARGVIIANGWQVQAIRPVMAATVINVVLAVTAIGLDTGIIGVAVASSISYALLLAFLFAFLKNRYRDVPARWAHYGLALIWPFMFLTLAIVGLEGLASLSGLNRWLVIFLQVGIFMLLGLGFVQLGHRLFPLVAPLPLNFPASRDAIDDKR